MNNAKKLNKVRELRAGRARAKIRDAGRPRLSVFRSNTYMTGQIIDDTLGKTVVSASSKSVGEKGDSKLDKAKTLGKEIGKKSVKAGVKAVVFDRGRYAYHGRVKAFAEGAREGGLEF